MIVIAKPTAKKHSKYDMLWIIFILLEYMIYSFVSILILKIKIIYKIWINY